MAQAHVNGAVLKWAREKARLSLEEAAVRAGLNDLRKVTAAERLLAWEEGREYPTPTQLKDLAKAYHRPLITFYLKKPPSEDRQIPDFRTLADAPLRGPTEQLEALLRRLRARQQEVRQILVDDGAQPLPFVGCFGLESGAAVIVDSMRQVLDVDVHVQRRAGDRDALFRLLRTRLEAVGVFVQVIGDLGSHHTAIEPEEFRGLALSDDVAPFVVLNSNDARAAFPFTLLHEAAHVWLGESGISNASPFEGRVMERRVEQLCNEVAAEFLLPREAFLASWRVHNHRTPLITTVASLAKEWKVSRAVIAHRLWRHGEISEANWWNLYRAYQDEWRRNRERQREKNGGPTYYITTKSHLGGALIRTVLGAVDAGTVTYTQAARILNVKAKSFDGLRDGGT